MSCLNIKKISIGLFFAAASFAHAEQDKAKFEENKAKAVSHLDQRLSNIQEAKACASAAGDQQALRACFNNLHAKQGQMKMDFMNSRHERMKNRADRMQKKLDEKKAKAENAGVAE